MELSVKPTKPTIVLLLVFGVIWWGYACRAEGGTSPHAAANRTVPAAAIPDGYLTPEQFGARGDGTDDTAAFVAVHRAIQAKGYGGIVLQPGRTYGINIKARSVLFRMSNLGSYGIDARGGATIRDLGTYRPGENAIAFQFINCRNIRIRGGLRLISQAYDGRSNTTGLSWFKFVSGCNGINADVDFDGGLHGFHFYRAYGEPPSASTVNANLAIRAKQVYYPELHERSGDQVTTVIEAVDCGRAFFIFGGGNNVTARITAKNSFGFLISSDSAGNGAENITIDYRDRDSDRNKADAWRCGVQFYNEKPAVFRNIRVRLDVRNAAGSPFYDTFSINKVSDTGGQDTRGRGHMLDGLDIAGVSEQVNGRKHITTYGAFAAPDQVRNVRIHDFRGTGRGSDIHLALGDALADAVIIENVALPEKSVRILHTTGRAVFDGNATRNDGSKQLK